MTDVLSASYSGENFYKNLNSVLTNSVFPDNNTRMDITVILITLLLVFLVGYCFKTAYKLSTWKRAGIPYVPALPLVGNMGPFVLGKIQIGELFQQYYNMFPDAKYFGITDCTTPVIMLRDPEVVTQITIKNFDHFANHHGFATDADELFGKSLLELKDDRWKSMRSLLSPVFTASKFKYSFSTISDCAKSFTDVVKRTVERGDKVLQMKDFADRYTNDVICKFAFGIDVDTVKHPDNEVYKTGKEGFAFNGPLSLRLLMLNDFPLIAKVLGLSVFTPKIQKMFKKIIQTVLDERVRRNIVKVDMLQLMIDEMKKIDPKVKVDIDDIMAQAFFFFLAGFETTSSYLISTIYILGVHQEIQDKLIEEIDEVNKRTNGDPSYDDIKGMTYLDCVINEVGRLYGPIPFVNRKCVKRYELPPTTSKHPPLVIEPGTVLYIPIYALQRDPKHFSEPDKFDPDRFLNQSVNLKSGTFLPFGIGPRVCIGARLAVVTIKMYLFHLLCKVRIKPIDGSVFPMKMAPLSFNILPFDGAWVELANRI